jgi:hypothetical protein
MPDDPPLSLRWVSGGEEVTLAISIVDAREGHRHLKVARRRQHSEVPCRKPT